MSLRRYRPLALVLLVLHLGACTSWGPTTVSPPQFIQEEEPSAVRVTRMDGTRIVVFEPEVRADSVVGVESAVSGRDVRVAVAVSEIQRIEARRFSGARTLILVGIPAALGVALLLVIHSFPECEPGGSIGPCR